jgi:hypothetical protein
MVTKRTTHQQGPFFVWFGPFGVVCTTRRTSDVFEFEVVDAETFPIDVVNRILSSGLDQNKHSSIVY